MSGIVVPSFSSSNILLESNANAYYGVVTLPKYARRIGYSECAFFGVSNELNTRFACREIWSQTQRDEISSYLTEAQELIEQIIKYPLQPKWFFDEEHKFARSILAHNGKIIESGVPVRISLSDGVVVTLSDTCLISLIMDLSDIPLDEIYVFYPGTDQKIEYSKLEYVSATTTLRIEIPRCRLVKYSLQDNPEEGLVYDDDLNFQSTVDVHRIYTDSSVEALLVYRGQVCSSFCTESTLPSCQYISNAEVGVIQVDPGPHCGCTNYERVRLNYRAGLQTTDRRIEDAIIRLAHSLMPNEPCGCDVSKRLWMRDRDIPKILTRERIECPFGLSDGAWVAWKMACSMELVRASSLYG